MSTFLFVRSSVLAVCRTDELQHDWWITPWKLTAKAPENRPPQNEDSLPTIIFRGNSLVSGKHHQQWFMQTTYLTPWAAMFRFGGIQLIIWCFSRKKKHNKVSEAVFEGLFPMFPRWWFQTVLIFTRTWGDDPVRPIYFSNGLKPPTSSTWCSMMLAFGRICFGLISKRRTTTF